MRRARRAGETEYIRQLQQRETVCGTHSCYIQDSSAFLSAAHTKRRYTLVYTAYHT